MKDSKTEEAIMALVRECITLPEGKGLPLFGTVSDRGVRYDSISWHFKPDCICFRFHGEGAESPDMTTDSLFRFLQGAAGQDRSAGDFGKTIRACAMDLAIEFTVGGDRFDRDDIALVLYEAGLKAEQLPAFREYVKGLEQCSYPYEAQISMLRSDVEARHLLPETSEFQELQKLERDRSFHFDFLDQQIGYWLPDNVLEIGEAESRKDDRSVGEGAVPGVRVPEGMRELSAEEMAGVVGGVELPAEGVEPDGLSFRLTTSDGGSIGVRSDHLFYVENGADNEFVLGDREMAKLKAADAEGLLCEVVMSAVSELRDDPELSVGVALDRGLRDWDVTPPLLQGHGMGR